MIWYTPYGYMAGTSWAVFSTVFSQGERDKKAGRIHPYVIVFQHVHVRTWCCRPPANAMLINTVHSLCSVFLNSFRFHSSPDRPPTRFIYAFLSFDIGYLLRIPCCVCWCNHNHHIPSAVQHRKPWSLSSCVRRAAHFCTRASSCDGSVAIDSW